LATVVAHLAEQSGAVILVDAPALAAAGLSTETESRLRAAAIPLEAALAELTKSLDLTFRVVGAGIVEITTSEAAAKKTCIEFFPLRGVVGPRSPGHERVQQLQAKLLDSAGVDSASAAMVYDAPSQCLIVAAPYADQVRLENGIGSLDGP
jgi:hypothetical protein